jgi:predicted transcriptional regulator
MLNKTVEPMPAKLELPHGESIVLRVVTKQRQAAAADIAQIIYPGLAPAELRPKTSQVSVTLKRLEQKGLLVSHKIGRKNFFRVLA